MSNADSRDEQPNGKRKLSPAQFRGRLEEIMQDLGALLAQIDDEQHEEATRGPDMVNGAADRMLDVDEVAARLGFSKGYVYHRAKDWPFTRKLGPKALRFSETALERWLSSKGDAATELGLRSPMNKVRGEYPELDEELARGDAGTGGSTGGVAPAPRGDARGGHAVAAGDVQPVGSGTARVAICRGLLPAGAPGAEPRVGDDEDEETT